MVGYIIGGAGVIAAAALAGLLLYQKHRLQRLTEAMERYLTQGEGCLSFSLKEDAVAPVENAAAELENRVEIARERYRAEAKRTSSLTADISHQLKTPLSSLRLFCEMDAGPHMAQQLDQIERMETLIGRLLRLEKLCADGYEFTFREISLRALLQGIWADLALLWPEKRLVIEGKATLRGDEKWLGEAFMNLLKNACEHTSPGGTITVTLDSGEQTAYCTLEDDGGGVSARDLPHLFERFYRAEGGTGKGAGLGLAIVKEIILRHHGHIRAENTGRGLKFHIALPLLHMTRQDP